MFDPRPIKACIMQSDFRLVWSKIFLCGNHGNPWDFIAVWALQGKCHGVETWGDPSSPAQRRARAHTIARYYTGNCNSNSNM
jgi:hypothetical protein